MTFPHDKEVTDNDMQKDNRHGAEFRLLPFLFAAMLFFGACASVDCPLNNRVQTEYYFTKPDGITPDTLNDTLSIKALKWADDTLLFNRGVGITSIKVPLSYEQPEDVLLFIFTDTAQNVWRDTVWLKKTNHPHLESVDCSPKFFHTLTDVHSTHHRIERIAINNPTVEYESKENIQIHLIRYY